MLLEMGGTPLTPSAPLTFYNEGLRHAVNLCAKYPRCKDLPFLCTNVIATETVYGNSGVGPMDACALRVAGFHKGPRIESLGRE